MSSRAAASVTAVIAAAGSGERLGAGGPKAFVSLAGRPMVEWSVDAFQAAGVAAIVVAVPPEFVSSRLPDIRQVGPGGGSTLVVEGGATRAESVANALAAAETELVAIHDAARPLVTPELIEGVIATLVADPEADGAIAATSVTDTIKRAAADMQPPPDPSQHLGSYRPPNAGISVEGTVDRDVLWAAQTPQVFRIEELRRALEGANARVETATDEAMLIEATGGRVLIHPASPDNVKVTTPTDLRLAELLLRDREA
jgi:2-C-methyl-D-erythritol 4-phosphate cytidylyltransferase